MKSQRAVGIPPRLLAHGRRVVRPQDAVDVYTNPAAEFRRMTESGVLRKVASGYYVVTPQADIGDETWRPTMEDLALGIAAADYGNRAALMGLTAARYHGAYPRAHAVAWIATEVSRRPLDAGRYGRIHFIHRKIDAVDTVRARTDVADGWVTSVEQTAIDLMRRPDWGGGNEPAGEAVANLLPRCDEKLLEQLAVEQRGLAALTRTRSRAS